MPIRPAKLNLLDITTNPVAVFRRKLQYPVPDRLITPGRLIEKRRKLLRAVDHIYITVSTLAQIIKAEGGMKPWVAKVPPRRRRK
jgi:hypothetical protein